MSQVHRQKISKESEEAQPQLQSPPNHTGGREPAKLARRAPAPQEYEDDVMPAPLSGRRISLIRGARIRDRPAKVDEEEGSLKIKIDLLEVEVELYTQVRGDVTVGLL
ncbi:uncharacterized protein N7479_010498 [Penicillium vulpinum]|uniref:Uncharacterized protein n=1 Tax=Penicillium vulpinum TaxID=29845 RepID=A0A1V6S9F5_9EURO|nr:uncharacterized protein N7479_010498 [Penicillium vulpinum]KAJ5952085.1 hypothetical protein N7479_010498 [Penicillium vulpinum]OQE10488.1 hypothetical protein PENVUL_c004G04695 [Penicillium vulpinum]